MLTVRLPEELEREVKRLAEEENRPKSQIVKEALQAYVAAQRERQSSYEYGKDLFGIAASGREDLSADYKRKLKGKLGAKHAH